ncbi:hypothetical protein CHARACLAT_027848 [Characodon lateralis]|uniref:Uncharacterized protein n=1 Tax=Characodon lateralis TaxID=208331 RepID=A0ABU7DAM6_9TELE|nr:hypothetical protein [Characodon lateralis]
MLVLACPYSLILFEDNRELLALHYNRTIHPSLVYTSLSVQGHRGAGACLQQLVGKRRDTPLKGHQSITGQHRDTQDKQPSTNTLTPKSNSEKTVHQTHFWTVGGSRSIQREHMHAWGEHTNYCYKATVLPTMKQCSPL